MVVCETATADEPTSRTNGDRRFGKVYPTAYSSSLGREHGLGEPKRYETMKRDLSASNCTIHHKNSLVQLPTQSTLRMRNLHNGAEQACWSARRPSGSDTSERVTSLGSRTHLGISTLSAHQDSPPTKAFFTPS